MSQLNDIIDRIAFVDELSSPTKFREFSNEDNFEQPNNQGHNERFDDLHFELPKRPAAPLPPLEPEEPYDAEANAANLVRMITAVDQLVLKGIGTYKVNKAVGGSKKLKEMRSILVKELSEELTEDEKKLKAKFLEWKTNIELLDEYMTPSKSSVDDMIESAIPMCEASRIKIGGGWAFATTYVGSLGQRVMKLIQM